MKTKARSITAMLLLICIMTTALTGCKTKDLSVSRKLNYDEGKYALDDQIEDITFLVPREFYDFRVSYNDVDNYSQDDRIKTAFEWFGNTSYSIFMPGTFGVYAFNIGRIDHVEGKDDINTLASFLRVSKYLTFTPRSDKKKIKTSSNTNTGTIVNLYPVVIHDDTVVDGEYTGYLKLIKRGDNGKVYALACGFMNTDSSKDETAEFVAESLECTGLEG